QEEQSTTFCWIKTRSVEDGTGLFAALSSPLQTRRPLHRVNSQSYESTRATCQGPRCSPLSRCACRRDHVDPCSHVGRWETAGAPTQTPGRGLASLSTLQRQRAMCSLKSPNGITLYARVCHTGATCH